MSSNNDEGGQKAPRWRVVSFEDFGRELLRRREAFGTINMPRNSGNRRTESKRALLAAIKATGKRW